MTSASDLSREYLEESIGYRLVNTAIAFIVLGTVFTVLRVFARRQQKSSFMWADILVPLALLTNISLCILCITVVKYAGAGRHTKAIMITHPEIVPTFFKILYISVPVFYCLAAALPKLAIIDIYLSIFVERWSRWTTYATGLIIALNAIINIPITIWQCTPVAYLWDSSIPGGHCHNIPAHFLYAGLPNIVTDVFMLIVPIPMIVKLHASRKMKAGVAVTFLTGSIGLITSILRFIGFTQSYEDPLWASIQLTVWTVVEPGIYLIAACLFTLRPLVTYIVYRSPLSSLLSKAGSTTKSKGSNGSIDHAPSQRLSSGDENSNMTGLVPEGLGDHNTYVMHGRGDGSSKLLTTPGIQVERQFSTRSSSVSRG